MDIIDTIKMLAREEGLEEGYEEGLEKGVEQKSLEVVRKLLLAEKFTDAEVANFASVSDEFVRKVKSELKK